jgi:hypothetical protein
MINSSQESWRHLMVSPLVLAISTDISHRSDIDHQRPLTPSRCSPIQMSLIYKTFSALVEASLYHLVAMAARNLGGRAMEFLGFRYAARHWIVQSLSFHICAVGRVGFSCSSNQLWANAATHELQSARRKLRKTF